MKFKTVLQTNPQYSELVSTVGWLNADEVYSSGDDHCVLKWNQLSGDSTLAVQLGNDVYATDLHWLPRSIGAKKQASSDVFLLTSTEGKYYLVSRAGRIEKSVDAHQGAILAGRWNHDGSALLTAGEDGQLKLWSRSGMLRSTLVSLAVPVYSAVWSPNSDAVLHSNGKLLSIKPLQPSLKAEQWKAHEGIILKVDWNAVNNTIVSGGEDCKYKVWDVFGRLLYSSSSNDYPITSVAWSTNGELFAVGSFNTLRLCDKAGWSYALEKPNSGSLFNLAWAHDGTQLAAACGSGQVLFASLIERRLEWQNFEATLAQEKVINVKDVLTDAKETLDFRDRVVKMALSHSHLVVTTPSQCYIYSTKNWNTPMIFDLKSGSVSLLMLAENHFLIVDDTGIQLYTYEGRFISAPKYASMRPDLMSEQIVSLSNDTVVVRDKADEKAMYFFEAATGKPLVDGKPVRHVNDIVEIALNQDGPPSERQVAIIDKNRDLHIRAVRQYGAEKTVKIATMVSSMCWSDTVNMLATVAENKLSIWYHPVVAYSDRDLLPKTVATRDAGEFGKNVELLHFSSTFLTMRRGDGSLCSTSVSPYPAFLHKFQLQAKWDQALRLCRFVKEDSLWACLAAMATNAKELTVSEIAYAAINEVAKVQYINKIKDIPSAEGKSAALALLCGQLQDAEIVLVQAGLFYRAIQMHIDLFNWDRALELAVKHKTHVDTVLGFRNEYLRKCKRQETSKKFLQFAQGVEVDMEKIRMKINMELDKEAQRSGTTAMVR